MFPAGQLTITNSKCINVKTIFQAVHCEPPWEVGMTTSCSQDTRKATRRTWAGCFPKRPLLIKHAVWPPASLLSRWSHGHRLHRNAQVSSTDTTNQQGAAARPQSMVDPGSHPVQPSDQTPRESSPALSHTYLGAFDPRGPHWECQPAVSAGWVAASVLAEQQPTAEKLNRRQGDSVPALPAVLSQWCDLRQVTVTRLLVFPPHLQ